MVESERKDAASNLLAEYEEVIRSMQIQLELTKEEHKNLKADLLLLISENQNLSGKLDAEYRERIENVNEDFSEGFKSEIVINLQNQLDICKREKERTLELYKTSLKLIENLEEKISTQEESLLQESQGKTVSATPPIVTVLEAKLKNVKEHLDMVVNERERIESDNIKQQTEIAKLKLALDNNNKIIDQLKSKEEEWKGRCFKMDQEYALLNATYECVLKSRNDLEKKLDMYSSKIQKLVEKNNESRSKVEEALDLIEKALAEKNEATLRELQLKEEINKLHLCLEHVIDEAGKKVGAEIEETKKKFEAEKKKLSAELGDVRNELERKKLEHKRISFKYKKMEKLASAKLDKEKISLIKGSETEITILENQLDSVYQELERFKTKYEELGRGKKKLEDEFAGLIEKHQSLMKDKESRENFLEETINDLKSQIDHKIENLNEASKRSEFFVNQVKNLQEENKGLKNKVESCNCDKLRSKIKKLNEVRAKQRTELEAHVESQMNLNETWKKEIKEITEKFEERIRELKKECGELKAKNKKLVSELNLAKKKISLLENV